MKKMLVIILAAVLLPVMLIGCLRLCRMTDDRILYNKIVRFVEENEPALTNLAEARLNGTSTENSFLGVKIEGVYGDKNAIVQFYYDGRGIAPSSTYYGFYYSPSDQPAGHNNNPETRFEQIGENEWTYLDRFGNGGRTVRIMEHWFYYEAWN